MSRGLHAAGRSLLKALLWPVVRWRGSGSHVYLTFDDGPSTVGTERILDALDAARVKATFFLTGSEILRHPALARAVRDRGHRIGSHGFEHRHVADMSWREQILDLRRMRDLSVSSDLGINCYRPPYGELSVLRILWCAWTGMKVIMWSLDSGDSHVDAAGKVEGRVAAHTVGSGDILLFHDDSAITAELLPGILERLKLSGSTFSTQF